MVISNLSEKLQCFWSHYLFLRLVFLLLRELLVATFKEKRAPTFKKNVAEQGIVMPN